MAYTLRAVHIITILTCLFYLTACINAGAKFQAMNPSQQISEIQSDLKTLGYYSGSVDGINGKKTASAIRNFQGDHGMAQNGMVSKSVYIQAVLAVRKQRKPQSIVKPYSSQTKKNSKTRSTSQILQSKLRPPSGSPSNSIIEKAVRAELHNNIPGKWIGYTIPGSKEKFRHMEIKKWGGYNKEQKYWPVRIQVVGQAVVIPPFGKQMPVAKFDAIAEFLFFENDFGEWKSKFMRPSVF